MSKPLYLVHYGHSNPPLDGIASVEISAFAGECNSDLKVFTLHEIKSGAEALFEIQSKRFESQTEAQAYFEALKAKAENTRAYVELEKLQQGYTLSMVPEKPDASRTRMMVSAEHPDDLTPVVADLKRVSEDLALWRFKLGTRFLVIQTSSAEEMSKIVAMQSLKNSRLGVFFMETEQLAFVKPQNKESNIIFFPQSVLAAEGRPIVLAAGGRPKNFEGISYQIALSEQIKQLMPKTQSLDDVLSLSSDIDGYLRLKSSVELTADVQALLFFKTGTSSPITVDKVFDLPLNDTMTWQGRLQIFEGHPLDPRGNGNIRSIQFQDLNVEHLSELQVLAPDISMFIFCGFSSEIKSLRHLSPDVSIESRLSASDPQSRIEALNQVLDQKPSSVLLKQVHSLLNDADLAVVQAAGKVLGAWLQRQEIIINDQETT